MASTAQSVMAPDGVGGLCSLDGDFSSRLGAGQPARKVRAAAQQLLNRRRERPKYLPDLRALTTASSDSVVITHTHTHTHTHTLAQTHSHTHIRTQG